MPGSTGNREGLDPNGNLRLDHNMDFAFLIDFLLSNTGHALITANLKAEVFHPV